MMDSSSELIGAVEVGMCNRDQHKVRALPVLVPPAQVAAGLVEVRPVCALHGDKGHGSRTTVAENFAIGKNRLQRYGLRPSRQRRMGLT